MPLFHTHQYTHSDFYCWVMCAFLLARDIALSVFFPQGMIVWDVFEMTSQKNALFVLIFQLTIITITLVI